MIPSLRRSRPHRLRCHRGSAVVMMLMLLALMTVISIGTSWSLTRLRAEVIAVEQRQAARIAGTNVADGTNAPHAGVVP